MKVNELAVNHPSSLEEKNDSRSAQQLVKLADCFLVLGSTRDRLQCIVLVNNNRLVNESISHHAL